MERSNMLSPKQIEDISAYISPILRKEVKWVSDKEKEESLKQLDTFENKDTRALELLIELISEKYDMNSISDTLKKYIRNCINDIKLDIRNIKMENNEHLRKYIEQPFGSNGLTMFGVSLKRRVNRKLDALLAVTKIDTLKNIEKKILSEINVEELAETLKEEEENVHKK